ncbi:peptidase domain-containing ABC transporter [Viscerimonas tarda]
MSIFEKFPTSYQVDTKDCGPACLQIICKYYDIHYDIEYLREISGARKEGTSVYDLVMALEKLNIKSLVLQTSYKKLQNDVPMPCIVHWKGNHYIVVYKITKKHVYVSDPQIGLIKYKKSEFVKGWLGHIKEKDAWKKGICIAIEPTGDFKNTTSSSPKSNYLEALRYVWEFVKPYKKNVFQVILVLVVITFISALFPVITQTIIDVGIGAKDTNFVMLMIIASVVLNISSSLGTWVQQSINTHFAARIKISMISDYLNQLFKLPLSFFESRLMGDLLQRSYDYDRIESLILYTCFNTILGGLFIIVFGFILYVYNSLLFWLYVSLSILYVIWTVLFLSIRRKMDIKYFSYLSYNHSHWMELLSKIIDIKSYNYGKSKRWQWEKVQVGLYKTRIKLLHIDQIETLGGNLINVAKDLLLIYISVTSVIKGEMTFGMLIAVQYIIGQLNTPMNSIIQFITTAQLSYISFIRISEIRKAKTEHKENAVSDELINYNEDIKLDNVYFKYSINENYVLKGVSFIIPKGKVTAIAGASGSGKSTLIKILMQLYTVSSGEIFIGNTNFSSIAIDNWRCQCGIITQESTIFKDTILNNITFGRPFNKEKVISAVKMANIQNEIEMLPMGYNTMLGENGRGLSAGQQQRILYARAVYDNPQFIFMDEITSTLDSNNEQEILRSIKKNLSNQTIVISAHRLSTIINADQIIVLVDGKVVETGTHTYLMSIKKNYYKLFESQTK